MTSTLEARHLNWASIGKTVEIRTGNTWTPPATVVAVQHTEAWTELAFDGHETQLQPTNHVRITGKDRP